MNANTPPTPLPPENPLPLRCAGGRPGARNNGATPPPGPMLSASSPPAPDSAAPAAAPLSGAGSPLRCAADDCAAGAQEGSVRTVCGERWFVCTRGHLNAETINDFQEAA